MKRRTLIRLLGGSFISLNFTSLIFGRKLKVLDKYYIVNGWVIPKRIFSEN